ncbi:hypothetical protein [Actinocatenispora rupis]|uniref:Uncharacterized protein n=1 Tax=Actinocatenispora rupis TaxID=519421 RepID=A0A8J3NGV6_9ACTN|nr:hypothetical protein [Actinocatenispora rupis]GID15269.1 hypothetical protein Aru02nite_61580 [Actinocatenispora rupis]
MSELATYRRLRAYEGRRAVAAASRCHAYLADAPLVVVGYHLAGDPGAPVALRYGTAPDAWRTVVMAEPRNRDVRFAALADFATDLLAYLAGFAAREEVTVLDRRGVPTGTEQVCPRAPQLLVPNQPTAAWLCDTLGRSLRYLRTDGEYAVDGALPAAGAHLSFLAGRRVLPGSALVLAAGGLLTTHWVTGQLPAEDADLHAALGWVDPSASTDGPAAARAGEALPAAGPVPDPEWDAEVLTPAVETYHADGDAGPLRVAAEEALAPAWEATWRVRELVGALPPAAHAEPRWESDRRAWTHHMDRVDAGTAHFSTRLDQLRAFRFLGELEARTAALERQMALDDPLVLAGYVASGEALAGTVVGRDHERRELSARGTKVLRPLLRIRPDLPFDRPPGTELWVADRPGVQVRTGAPDADGVLDCVVVKGMGRRPEHADAALPQVGAAVVLAPFGPQPVFGDTLPDELPWTHQGPA